MTTSAETTSTSARLPTLTAWTLAIAATLTMAVSYFDRQVLAVLAPTVTKELGISDVGYGWLVSAFSLAYLVGSPLAGKLIDLVGARRGLLGAVLLWTVVAALHSLVPSFGVLVALRLALGFAEAPSFPGSTQTVHRALPPEDRARGFGLLFTGSSLGALVAPIAASYLAVRFNWRIAFLVTAVAGLLWIPMWWLVTRAPAAKGVLDAPPGEKGRTPASIMATLANPAVLRAAIVVLASAPLVGFVLNWSAKYLASVEHIPQAQMGRYLWIPPVIYDVGSIGFGHLASVYQRRHGRPSKALFFACGLLASTLVLLLAVHGPMPAMIIAGACLAGVAGLFAIFTADMLGRVPANSVSTAGGITAAAQSLVYIAAMPLVGWAVGKTGSYTLPIAVLSAMVLPGVIVWMVWEPAPAKGGAE